MFLSLPITNNSLCSQGSVGLKKHLLCTQTVFVGGTGIKRAMSFDFSDEEILSNLTSPAISNDTEKIKRCSKMLEISWLTEIERVSPMNLEIFDALLNHQTQQTDKLFPIIMVNFH